MAFKALNRRGTSETVTSTILDENGEELNYVNTRHAGMGVFGYIPKTGEKRYMKCRNENGLEKQFELPPPDALAYSLTASVQ